MPPSITFTRLRRGFTIAELLATMTLLAIVSTVVARLLLGQQRFYQQQSQRITVRRELRSAMSLLPADLRSLSSSGGDLVAFSATSITFRNVLGGSIVCAKPNSATLDLPPLYMARNILTSWYTQPQVGDTVFAFNEGMLRGAEDDTWTALRVTGVAQSNTLCPASPYIDAVLDANKPRWRISVSPAVPDSVKVGAGVRFVRSTRYQLTQSASAQWYLSRSEYLGGAWTAAAPVSGPYEAPSTTGTSGIQFRYFDSTGVAVTSAANSRRVARIDLVLRARGANSSGPATGPSTVNEDSLAFRIALRNRQ